MRVVSPSHLPGWGSPVRARNPKSEARNPTQIQNFKTAKHINVNGVWCFSVPFCRLGFVSDFEFRASDFRRVSHAEYRGCALDGCCFGHRSSSKVPEGRQPLAAGGVSLRNRPRKDHEPRRGERCLPPRQIGRGGSRPLVGSAAPSGLIVGGAAFRGLAPPAKSLRPFGAGRARNPKPEARNSKQIQNGRKDGKHPNGRAPGFGASPFGFAVWDLFRISSFVLRISAAYLMRGTGVVLVSRIPAGGCGGQVGADERRAADGREKASCAVLGAARYLPNAPLG